MVKWLLCSSPSIEKLFSSFRIPLYLNNIAPEKPLTGIMTREKDFFFFIIFFFDASCKDPFVKLAELGKGIS